MIIWFQLQPDQILGIKTNNKELNEIQVWLF